MRGCATGAVQLSLDGPVLAGWPASGCEAAAVAASTRGERHSARPCGVWRWAACGVGRGGQLLRCSTSRPLCASGHAEAADGEPLVTAASLGGSGGGGGGDGSGPVVPAAGDSRRFVVAGGGAPRSLLRYLFPTQFPTRPPATPLLSSLAFDVRCTACCASSLCRPRCGSAEDVTVSQRLDGGPQIAFADALDCVSNKLRDAGQEDGQHEDGQHPALLLCGVPVRLCAAVSWCVCIQGDVNDLHLSPSLPSPASCCATTLACQALVVFVARLRSAQS